MKPKKYSTLDLSLTVLVPGVADPATFDFAALMAQIQAAPPATLLAIAGMLEYDEKAKSPSACVDSANDNTAYRGVLTESRSAFVDLLAAQTGIARLTKPTAKKVKQKVIAADGSESFEEVDGTTWAETEAVYFDRVKAILAKQRGTAEEPATVDVAEFQPIMDRLSVGGDKEVKFDPSARERQPVKPKTLPKDYLDAGTNVMTGTHPGTGQTLLSMFEAKYGATAADGTPWTADSVGWKIRELKLAKLAAEKAQLATEFIG